jgi:hypothetical protein
LGAVALLVVKPIAMFPWASIAALPIQRWRPSAGAYVLCWVMPQLPDVRVTWYQRMPARSEPTSTVWLTTMS